MIASGGKAYAGIIGGGFVHSDPGASRQQSCAIE